MAEFVFYIVCIIILGGWMFYKIKNADLYLDWVEE